MSLRCDVAIIGGGADGLAAAALLGQSGLKAIVLERNVRVGGRCTTREFHPGFRASPFADEIAPIPAVLHWALDLSRRGAIFVPARAATALWPDGSRAERLAEEGRLFDQARAKASEVRERAGKPKAPVPWYAWLAAQPDDPWPAAEWKARSVSDVVWAAGTDPRAAALAIACATASRAVDPFQSGSALHLLAPGSGGSGIVMGGLGTLATSLEAAARSAGADIRCGLEVGEVRQRRGRAAGVSLADGTEIEAAAVLSTLDLRRTFAALFKWSALPKDVTARLAAYRMSGATARILFALSSAPQLAPHILRAPIFIAPDAETFRVAHSAWSQSLIPEIPPIQLRCVSACDPSLAPIGAATLTATVGCIPYKLFDGPWAHEKREALLNTVLKAIDAVIANFSQTVLAADVLVPPDIEHQIGCSEGDLDGGEIAPDQMFGARPGLRIAPPRTFLRGLYLAGRSTPTGPLATCAAGTIAARAIIADFAGRRMKRAGRADD